LDLFEECRRDPTLPAPPAAFAGGHLASITDLATLFADVRRFFAELAAERPALVILEDFHWSDPASLDLLRHVGPHVRHWPLQLIVTYRSEELTPSLPLTRHLPAMVREADGQRLDLRRLGADALRTLIATQYRLSRQDEDRLLHYLERHAEGNPFFATEILRTLEANGVFEAGEGILFLAALDQVTVPTLLRQVIEGRVASLGAAMRKPLSMAAVIGQEVPLTLWAEIAGLTEAEIIDIVEQAVEAHLLEAERDGTRVRFVHAVTREAIYEGILPPRRRTWHRMIAEALMASDRPNPDPVAFHLQAADDPCAVDWLMAAGERAQRAYAWLTAAERYRAAVALLEAREGQERARCRILTRIFYLLRFAYPAGALASLDEALRLARQTGDAFAIAETRGLRGVLLCYTDRFRDGLAEMEIGTGAIERLPTAVQQTANTMQEWFSQAYTGHSGDVSANDVAVLDRLQAAGIDYRRSYFCWFTAAAGHHVAAAAIQKQFADIFASSPGLRSGIRLAAAFAQHAGAVIDAACGRPDGAREQWKLARPDFSDHHVLAAFTLLDELREVAVTFGAAEPAYRRWCAAEAEAALERAVGVLQPGAMPRLAWLRCLVFDGRWDEAQQILDELPVPENNYLRRETTFTRVVLARHRGQPELAWVQIRKLFPQGPATEPGDLLHQEALSLLRIAAGLCLDGGDLSGANGWLAAHDRWLAWNGCVLGQAEGQLAWGQYHHAAGEDVRARADLAAALSLSTQPAQPLVQFGAHLLLGEINTAAGQFDEANDNLTTAATLAESCDLPFERALTQLALAELSAAANNPEVAMDIANVAAEVFLELGATPSLARIEALVRQVSARTANTANGFGLTPRELDVLRLLAEGRTNAEIADALYISRRTAATHVSNIFHKLDVGTRAGAVDQAHRHNILSP
ncbi:MAG TPA: LuxR C-terminal-related transcriptional regulator, partial [Thermomicrobiales bacterium]|nr:LuxR C-terminal-related transcriptional regulator [Thermomicrobiales bacterium]